MKSDLHAIIDLLGETNVAKIKEAITDSLIENLEESIKKEWLVLPSEFAELWDELFTETYEKIKEKYMEQIEEVMCKQMEKAIKAVEGESK